MKLLSTMCLPVTATILGLAFALGGCGSWRPYASFVEQVKIARLPGDHAVLARQYRERAQRLRAEAADHAALAEWWSSLAGGTLSATGTDRDEQAQHCRRLAADLNRAAAEAEAMAEFHERSALPPFRPDPRAMPPSGLRHEQ